MSTPNVVTTHQDGGLGLSNFDPDRIHAKIGMAETGDALEPVLILNAVQAKTVFGRGPLVDSLKQHFEEYDTVAGETPSPVLTMRPENDVAGSVDTPVAGEGNTGDAALPSTSGTPTGSRTVILKFTKAGEHGVAEYRRSTDGGATFESPLVTPASGQPISLAVGVSATFTDAATPADTFKVGDQFTITIQGPTASNTARLAAVEALKREYQARWIHLLGGVDRAFAVSVQQVLNEMETDHHLPSFAILEAQTFEEVMGDGTEESEANVLDYLQQLDDEWDPFVSENGRVVVVAGQARYIPGGIQAFGGLSAVLNAASPVGEWRHPATFLAARLAAAPVNQSAAWVARNKSRTLAYIRHWSLGYRDYIDVLNAKGMTVLKEYDDYEGIFVAQDRIMSPNDSDFQEVPERRRADKMHRLVYQSSLPFLQGDTNPQAGGPSLDYVEATVNADVAAKMVQPGEISSAEIVLDPEKTFAQTGELVADMTMYIHNRLKKITWRTAFKRAGV